MDILWRDRGPEAAANNLNQAVHVARRALGPDTIEVRNGLIRLEAEIDVENFERAAAAAQRAGTPSAYRAALSLYGGELLPENRYDDWAEDRREALIELHELLESELVQFGDTGALRELPLETSSFIGRERELGELRALLDRTRLLTLTGTGGAGKTRLALELARGVAASARDGVAYVELAAVGAPGQVATAVAAALDVRALPGENVEDAIGAFLATRSLLVVLDNCEHVLASCATIADRLLRGAGGLRIVATSREPLRVPAEIVFRVPSLGIPDPEGPLVVGDLLGFEAVRLFVERAAAVAPGFELRDDNALDIARICFRLDGLPLAIELAAGRMGALGPASIAERLDDRFRLLRAGSQTAPTRQQTLAATLSWSHDLLSPEERVLLRRLAVFSGTFDLAAVEAVCSSSDVEEADIADVLARLVEKSLVAADDHPRERRYHLLETVRLYARERLDDAGEWAAFADRHAAWAMALAERESWSPLLDPEAPNLRIALDTLMARDPQGALRFCVALRPFWLRRIDLDEGRGRIEHALAAAPERTALRAAGLVASASLNLRAGMVASVGEGLLRESLSVAEEIDDARAQWRALHLLGGSTVAFDQPTKTFAPAERALAIAQREGFAAEAALSVYSLGIAHW
jgi:predicted ATPase